MNKKKNDTKRNRFVKSRSFLMLVALFIFILILAFFFGEGGVVEIIGTQRKIENLKENISKLEREKDALVKEVRELKKNPLALEKKAREKLWLMKKNEKVVVIVKEKDQKGKGKK